MSRPSPSALRGRVQPLTDDVPGGSGWDRIEQPRGAHRLGTFQSGRTTNGGRPRIEDWPKGTAPPLPLSGLEMAMVDQHVLRGPTMGAVGSDRLICATGPTSLMNHDADSLALPLRPCDGAGQSETREVGAFQGLGAALAFQRKEVGREDYLRAKTAAMALAERLSEPPPGQRRHLATVVLRGPCIGADPSRDPLSVHMARVPRGRPYRSIERILLRPN
jgi:hypothetical protein